MQLTPTSTNSHSTKFLNQWEEIIILLSAEGQPKQANVCFLEEEISEHKAPR